MEEDIIPDGLTARQQRFVEEYPIDCNGSAAAIRAGYEPHSAKNQASRLLTNEYVQEAIQKRREAISAKAELSVASILESLKVIQRRCLQNEPVYDRRGKRIIATDEDGEELGAAYAFDSKGAIKATELLGKHVGMFRDGVQLFAPDGTALGAGAVLRIEIVGIEPRQKPEDPPPPPVPEK